jgi:hypothetical protein
MMECGKICGGGNMRMDRTSASTTCTRVAHFLYSCPGFQKDRWNRLLKEGRMKLEVEMGFQE